MKSNDDIYPEEASITLSPEAWDQFIALAKDATPPNAALLDAVRKLRDMTDANGVLHIEKPIPWEKAKKRLGL